MSCFDSYDANNTMYTDRTVSNAADLQWDWLLCTGLSYWQNGKAGGIVSTHVDSAYWQRQCALFFPETDGHSYLDAANPESMADTINAHTQGWNAAKNSTRLIFANGEFDPWRASGVSSESRPNGPMESTESAPIQIIPGGFHCSDLLLSNAVANAGVQTVVDNEVKQIVSWVTEYYTANTTKRATWRN